MRYGEKVDMRGGGHFSGRLTAPLCCAGGIALQILKQKGIEIGAHLKQIGSVQDTTMSFTEPDMAALQKVSHETVAMVSSQARLKAITYIDELRQEGDSTGGIIELFATGLPAGLGIRILTALKIALAVPFLVFPALKALLSAAVLTVASTAVPIRTTRSV